MTIIDITILGLMLNSVLFALFSLIMAIYGVSDIINDPKQIIEFQKLERIIENHKDELRHASLDEKYKDFIILLMPFSGILKYLYLIYIINKAGGMYNYIKNETERLKRKRHER